MAKVPARGADQLHADSCPLNGVSPSVVTHPGALDNVSIKEEVEKRQ